MGSWTRSPYAGYSRRIGSKDHAATAVWQAQTDTRSAMNIGEIARRAGVSRSTVSYAISGKRTVSEATRRRIQHVIEELDYRPNANARALKEGRTRTIGLVIPPASRR